MFEFITKLFDYNQKQIEKYQKIISEINSFESDIRNVKDDDFPLKTKELKQRLANGENLNSILPIAFAIVREAARRKLGERHFDVQLMAGIALHEGKISEQEQEKEKHCLPPLHFTLMHLKAREHILLLLMTILRGEMQDGWEKYLIF